MIRHILNDGTELEDITGHIVRKEEAPRLYAMLDMIRERGEKENAGKNYEDIACG